MPHNGHDLGEQPEENQDGGHHKATRIENLTVENLVRHFSAAQADVADDEQQGADSTLAGKIIAGLAVRNKLPYLYTIGFSYKLVNLLIKILPVSLSQKLIYMLYAR